nr:copia protein [Tanacetum cinerariifolium]
SGPNWLFDIDALTKSMNYKPVVAGNQSNSNACTKACDDSSQDDGFQPSSDDGKKVDEDLRQESKCKNQEKEDNVNSTNNVNAAGTNGVNTVCANTNKKLPFDPEMPTLEDISTFNFSSDHEDDDEEASMNNLDTSMQEELLQFKLQAFWTLVDLPYGKRAIGTNWVFQNKKDERGIVIRNKARLVAQGHTQEEEIDYDEVFASAARIEAIRLFLTYCHGVIVLTPRGTLRGATPTPNQCGAISSPLLVARTTPGYSNKTNRNKPATPAFTYYFQAEPDPSEFGS